MWYLRMRFDGAVYECGCADIPEAMYCDGNVLDACGECGGDGVYGSTILQPPNAWRLGSSSMSEIGLAGVVGDKRRSNHPLGETRNGNLNPERTTFSSTIDEVQLLVEFGISQENEALPVAVGTSRLVCVIISFWFDISNPAPMGMPRCGNLQLRPLADVNDQDLCIRRS